MQSQQLLGGLAALGVVAAVVGSLVGLTGQLAANLDALAVVGLVGAVMAAVVGAGLLGRASAGTPYW